MKTEHSNVPIRKAVSLPVHVKKLVGRDVETTSVAIVLGTSNPAKPNWLLFSVVGVSLLSSRVADSI